VNLIVQGMCDIDEDADRLCRRLAERGIYNVGALVVVLLLGVDGSELNWDV
jgi:hypothetical protein